MAALKASNHPSELRVLRLQIHAKKKTRNCSLTGTKANYMGTTNRSLNAIVVQSKNCPLVVSTTTELKNITTTSDNNDI